MGNNLTDYIKTNVGPEQEISFAGPAVNWSGWDLPGLVDACDYVFIMGYAYWYNGSSTTGPNAPIGGTTYNLEQTIVNSTRGYGSCDKSKIILGLPYYGNKWKVSYWWIVIFFYLAWIVCKIKIKLWLLKVQN